MVSKVLPAPSFTVVQGQLTKVTHLRLGLALSRCMERTHRHLIFPCVIRNDMVTKTLEVQGELSVEIVYRDSLEKDRYKI